MDIEKMRDDFEQAIAIEAGEQLVTIQLSRKDDSYSTSVLIYAWWAWQKSRESLVIELPGLSGMNSSFVADGIQKTREHNRYNDAVKDCRKAIRASGVKTK